MSTETIKSFAALLEEALNKETNFFAIILPGLKEPGDSEYSALAQVFASGGVVAKQLVAKLFVEHLGDAGADYLQRALDVSRPRIFIEAASILGELKQTSAVAALSQGISIEHPELVLPAVKAISVLPPSHEGDDVLLKFFLTFPDEVLLSSGIRYLLGRQDVLVPKMLEKYRGLDEDRKMWVLKFLSEAKNAGAIKLFAEELDAMPLERGLYCVRGLGSIPSEESVECLVKHINNSEWFLRKRIVEALGATGMPGAVEPLLQMLDDDFVQVRAAAVESLSKVGNLYPQAIVEKVKRADGRVKINLIRAMGQLRNEAFLEPLIEILKDRDALFFSIDAIGDLGFAEAEFALRRLLKDDVWFNRLNALEALAKLDIKELVQIAQEASQDENDMVRNSAARILASAKARQASAEREKL